MLHKHSYAQQPNEFPFSRGMLCIRLRIRIGWRLLPGKFDESLDSSCPGAGREFGDPIDREVG
jgi:hypothetical protein